MPADSYRPFCQLLGHRFKNRALLSEALRHSSFVNEQPDAGLADNERLEFLGDAVLNLVVGWMLLEQYPQSSEGQLSRMRASLVNEGRLAHLAASLALGDYLKLGRGEARDGGQHKASLLADAFEAVVAAVFLDGGFRAAERLVRRHFETAVAEIEKPGQERDPKTRLQELVQATRHTVPLYRILDSSGPDHDKTFRVELRLDALLTVGTGKSRKAAEQDAARQALAILVPDGPP